MADPAGWEQIESLLDAALDVPGGERSRWLESISGEYPAEVSAEVRKLLAALDRHGDALDGLTPQAVLDSPRLQPGESVGAWQIDRLLSSGGQGTVFEVSRSGDFEQRAAMKVLRGQLTDPRLLRRFLRERQLLALLEHPGIPTLLDGGVLDDGSPWLVTEFIEGRPIDRYCADERLDLADRVARLRELAGILAYAHRSLVAHLDLKPSNVLVDREGRVWLLDFGIARMIGGDAVLTETLGAFTPSYAAPEQIRNERPTIHTDIYGLGALAYAVLAERPPFAADSVAATLDMAINSRPPAIPGLDPELWAIIAMALRKSPDDRYRSIDAMNADLESWLVGRPVAAVRGGRSYRLRKFVRRHRAATLVVIGTLVVAVGAASVYLGQQREIALQRDLAQQEAARATRLFEFLETALADINPIGGTAATVVEFLAAAQERSVSIEDPTARARLQVMLSGALGNAGEKELAEVGVRQALLAVEEAGMEGSDTHQEILSALASLAIEDNNLAAAEGFAREAYDHARATATPVDDLWALGILAYTLIEQGREDEARGLLDGLMDGLPTPMTIETLDAVGLAAIMAGRVAESAEQRYELADAMLEAVLEAKPEDFGAHVRERVILARAAVGLGRRDEALTQFRLAVDAAERASDGPPVNAAYAISQIASIERELGRFGEARAQLDRALALQPPAERAPRQALLFRAQELLLAVDAGDREQAAGLASWEAPEALEASSAAAAMAGAQARFLRATGAEPEAIAAVAPASDEALLAAARADCDAATDDLRSRIGRIVAAPADQTLIELELRLAERRCAGDVESAAAQQTAIEGRVGVDHWVARFWAEGG